MWVIDSSKSASVVRTKVKLKMRPYGSDKDDGIGSCAAIRCGSVHLTVADRERVATPPSL